jgi:AAA+ ATPase superfamily predicted ATPase
MIGREKEQKLLLETLESDESQFVAVYGRRRVGKTYLIRETFGYNFAFQHTGLQNGNKAEQLKEFKRSLKNAGMKNIPTLSDWSDAFFALWEFLKTLPEGKKVIFIDELQWLDTPKSKMVSALDHFWNAWATTRKDVVLVVCGSATSWIISKIVKNYGGLHNRLTRQIYLEPFTLHECELFAKSKHLGMSRRNILETYMVLGGIPYYWSFLNKGDSQAQSLDRLFFSKNGELVDEYNALYASLFKNPQPYIEVVSALGRKKAGMTRQEIIDAIKKNEGGKLTAVLEELEQCDFIRSYQSIGKKKKDTVFQLIDNFTLFYFKFMDGTKTVEKGHWSKIMQKSVYSAWSGLAFERICLQHVEQIKKALGISGVISNVYSWNYRPKDAGEKGVQIDLLIDRDDNVINLCEIKFSKSEYAIDAEYDRELHRKSDVFAQQTDTQKGVSIVMITTVGLVKNEWSNDINNQIVMDDLFNA